MSERIRIAANAIGQYNVAIQYSSTADVRYTAVLPKKRFHPRLLIRAYRVSSTSDYLIKDANQIIEFDNFILESASEVVEEKYQVIQTFGPDFIFLYGSKPRFFSYSGYLYNTKDKPWKNDWQRAWDRQYPIAAAFPENTSVLDTQRGILSGSNVVINGGIARLEYDGSTYTPAFVTDPANSPYVTFEPTKDVPEAIIAREGFLISMEIQINARQPNICPFKFTMFITNAMDY